MLAGMRSRFLLFFLWVFSVAGYLPVQAQINGVPPSVTSIGFGGRLINGVRPSVTSLGPNGYGNINNNDWFVFGNCCSNLFIPVNPGPPQSSGHHRRKHHDHDPADFAVGIVEPAYVPYAQEADDASPDVDYVHAPGVPDRDAANQHALYGDSLNEDALNGDAPIQDAPANRARYRDSAPEADSSAQRTPGEPEVPVTAQPSTVLVFKDGHQSDVLNYAIVGDTLFDISAGRTHKILLADLDLPATQKTNQDRGVDFQIPGSKARQ
jgi:hypothetical protein